VLTRELERVLSTYFGGDWLSLLGYLGEAPHPKEHLVTALPESKLRAWSLGERERESDGENRAKGDAGNLSVEQRLEVLRLYWEAFDGLHVGQRSGMVPLWGLVADKRFIQVTPHDHSPYQERLYEKLLPKSLRNEIERLWGSAMLPRAPGRMVTEPFPHALMAEAFGPALTFWHGCSLTAWFLCEGPYSRTDMGGLEEYHRRELAELAAMGTPVDRGPFLRPYRNREGSLAQRVQYSGSDHTRVDDQVRL